MSEIKPEGILTIGYGNRTPDELLRLLQQYGVKFLLDVRSVPYSHFKPEFNRENLATYLKVHSIRYEYFGETLGGRPDDDSIYTEEGLVDYAAVRASSKFQEGFQRLVAAWTGKHRVILMCSEIAPEMCHRSKLIGEALSAEGIPVFHIDRDGNACRHVDIMRRVIKNFDQPSLPGLEASLSQTSRKVYRKKEPNTDE